MIACGRVTKVSLLILGLTTGAHLHAQHAEVVRDPLHREPSRHEVRILLPPGRTVYAHLKFGETSQGAAMPLERDFNIYLGDRRVGNFSPSKTGNEIHWSHKNISKATQHLYFAGFWKEDPANHNEEQWKFSPNYYWSHTREEQSPGLWMGKFAFDREEPTTVTTTYEGGSEGRSHSRGTHYVVASGTIRVR